MHPGQESALGPRNQQIPLTSASLDRQSLARPALWLLPAGQRAPESYMAPEHLPHAHHSVTAPQLPVACLVLVVPILAPASN